MAKKSKKAATKKRRVEEETTEEVADTAVYEVESIVGIYNKGNALYYNVKWKDYPSEENTNEPEYRLVCDDKLLEYLVKRFKKSNYLDKIPTSVETLDKMKNNKEYILEVIEPLSLLGQLTVLGGSVKFVNVNTISSKVSYLKHIVCCDQSHVLHSLLVPGVSEIRRDMEQYQSELDNLQNLFFDYPKMSVKAPYQAENIFYSPPPLSHLLFEPVTEEMFIKRSEDKYHFAARSDTDGFNKVNVFVKDSHLKMVTNKQLEPIGRTERLCFGASSRFNVKLKLIQSSACGWSLYLNQEVIANTPLLIMAGIIRPAKVAQTCLAEEGEQVAFSSFIKIPSSGVCLDRRQYHDFSKYIPHSCEPTCGVRLVNSGNSVPDLVVYSLQHIGSFDSYAITLDYFKMFRDDIHEYFIQNPAPDGLIFPLYDLKLSFVHCQCEATKCHQVLQITRKNSMKPTKHPKKRSKLPSVLESEEPMFGGLDLLDSDKVYIIQDGKFTD